MLVVLCCFNDTPTTEIYTYLHTLSLHDALPISPARLYRLARARSLYAPRDRRRGLQGGQDPAGDGRAPVGAVGSLGQISREYVRSEEHTSELQSLMRISYAVFCLKKNKITTDIRKIKRTA